MSNRYPQHIGSFHSIPGEPPIDEISSKSPLPRAKIFSSLFIFSLLLGFGVLLFIDPIYQSRATLLLAATKDIDKDSSDQDRQKLSIEQRILASDKLLSSTINRVESETGYKGLSEESISDYLRTEIVPDTNLLDLIAEGKNPVLLKDLLIHWIKTYQQHHEINIQDSYSKTTASLNNELIEINQKVETARSKLNTFREEHDIVSAEREENEALAKLRGINQSMNSANEEVIKAKSHLDEINSQNKNGGNVVPKSQQDYVNDLKNQLTALHSRLTVLEEQYTREYIKLKPELRSIPEDIKALEQELSTIYSAGKQLAIDEARQEYESTKRIAKNLAQELEHSKTQARVITAIFAEHQSLVTDLAELEQVHRDALTRLAQIEAKQLDKTPQMTIVVEPSPARKIWPNYLLASIIIFGSSLAISIFVVWLLNYLLNRQQPDTAPLNGIYLYPASQNQNAVTYQGQTNPALEQETNKSLDEPVDKDS